jgi:hypothetical protein
MRKEEIMKRIRKLEEELKEVKETHHERRFPEAWDTCVLQVSEMKGNKKNLEKEGYLEYRR